MKKLILIVLIVAALQIPEVIHAQLHLQPDPPEPPPVFRMVEEAYRSGELTLDQQILQKFYIAVDREKALERFQPATEQPIRCLTPLLIEYREIREELQPATRNEIEAYSSHQCAVPDLSESFVSASGRFVIHFDRTGPDAVPSTDVSGVPGIPDFVEKAAFAADSSWTHEVGTIGFTDPLLPFNPYDIYMKNIGLYGFTCPYNSTSISTFFVIDNDFSGFPANAHPEGSDIGALFVTIAHEFKHAIQYTSNRWMKAPTESRSDRDSWLEMDATLMEDLVFDDANDYYNYIKEGVQSFSPHTNSLFGRPQTAIPTGSYSHMTWMLYFSETFGIEFWVEVWDLIEQDTDIPFLQAIRETLMEREESFGTHHTENYLWHIAAGPGSGNGDFGFTERENYPVPGSNPDFETYTGDWNSVPDSLRGDRNLSPLAAEFHRVVPAFNIEGHVQVSAIHDQPTLGVALSARFRDGSIKSSVYTGGIGKTQVRTVWEWSEISELRIAVVNYGELAGTSYKLFVENPLPQQIVLSNNYPNPFQDQTRIDFSLDRPLHVRLDITDSAGRLVQVLTDREYEPGFHYVDFEPRDLASGIYFYRMVAGGDQKANSMIYIRP